MSDNKTIKLSLLDNSHAFLREAVRKALSAQTDIHEWQFAIINLLQSLELSLKAILYKIHPILIYENIDVPKHTVSPIQALGRLENAKISSVSISTSERKKIEKAIVVRNQVVHSDFELKAEYASAKFFEIFSFLMYFQGRHLETEIENIISSKELEKLLAIEKIKREIANKAECRISEEKIDSEWVWGCPCCEHDTFVVQDSIDTCYTCRHTEPVIECSHCNGFYFEWELESFDKEVFDNTYGYTDFVACEECIVKIKEDIQNQQWEEEDYYQSLEKRHLYN